MSLRSTFIALEASSHELTSWISTGVNSLTLPPLMYLSTPFTLVVCKHHFHHNLLHLGISPGSLQLTTLGSKFHHLTSSHASHNNHYGVQNSVFYLLNKPPSDSLLPFHMPLLFKPCIFSVLSQIVCTRTYSYFKFSLFFQ